MMTMTVPALVALGSLLLFTLTSGKSAEVGRTLFEAAMVVVLLGLAGHGISV